MDKGMQKKCLQFLDGVLLGNYLWGVDKKHLVLLGLDLKSYEVIYTINLADKVDYSYVPRRIFGYGNWLYITPLYGAKVIGVDIRSFSIIVLDGVASPERSNADAFMYENCIFLVSRNLCDTVYKFNLQSKAVSTINLQSISETTIGGRLINPIIVGNAVWYVVYETNEIVKINLECFEWERISLGYEYCLYDMAYSKDSIWLLGKSELIKCTNECEMQLCVRLGKKDYYRHIIPAEEELLLIPYRTTEFSRYLIEDMRLEELSINNIEYERTTTGTITYGYCSVDNKILLLPWLANCMLEYEISTGLLNGCYIKYETSDCWTRDYEIIRNRAADENCYDDFCEYVNTVLMAEKPDVAESIVGDVGEKVHSEIKNCIIRVKG